MGTGGRQMVMVGLGAGLGSLARAGVSAGLVAWLGTGFPFGTLAVNVVGSFLIGLFASLTAPDGRVRASADVQNFVLAGFCGGFTTFSIFSLETLVLWEAGEGVLAALYVGLSAVLWLAAVWLGIRAGEAFGSANGAR